ncbi:uncharacterized protein PHALS_07376 [Plasmopara halstedii]|uniref:Uncharacterized protein n=1 Tax=Plasmopara halstedii TaxID=4781 RepID=A0A0P1B4B3_PLAHL|nr:uncharacterized protein PHALS_07376 [Plasmopara halstedii]CEG49622.1 hypothetical protein PHALS_07376 [Plasmopara halstedii]|eukprot:XP_024585991.1 hypothetical protein PHALS_07376 [Plasmopara halstedii]
MVTRKLRLNAAFYHRLQCCICVVGGDEPKLKAPCVERFDDSSVFEEGNARSMSMLYSSKRDEH